MIRSSALALCSVCWLMIGCEAPPADGTAGAGGAGGMGGDDTTQGEGDAGVDAGPETGSGAGGFESDLPEQLGGGRADAGVSSVDGAGGAGGGAAINQPGAVGEGDPADAERAIVEADVIQLEGTRLYALSRVAGLTVIEVSNPDALSILGRYRELPGEPFEMYLRDGVVVAMFSGWGQYVESDADSWQWVQTSKVVALDVADPTTITDIGSFDVAGDISDSRIVGDILYVVGYQNGYCWGCEQDSARTTVISLDVGDPRSITQVDQLHFADAQNQWGWSRRSVTVTEQRMYVAGPEYGTDSPQGSNIQVVDISDPAGDMVMGASVEVAGQISSRWQMDEHEGVLRVISQPPQWNLQEPPRVQTFTVASSTLLQPLGSTTLVLPRPEQLQSVRFDGPRGYAITFERTDPLFTIDLSDPAHPVQRGELEMPGFLYHMVPRGDRLLGLGFDQGNAEGAITVSVFDVSDLSAPSMIDRVNFGGTWGGLPEDQNRIHKAFKVLDEAGLILVPFTGWGTDTGGDTCSNSYSGGVQLVDFVGDSLTLRGMAPVDSSVRRAMLLGERLLTVSDERVQTFGIANRDQPTLSDRLVLARNVQRAYQLENSVARIEIGWWTGTSEIDFVAADEAGEPNASLGTIDLRSALESETACHFTVYAQETFVRGDQLEMLYEGYTYEANWTSSTSFRGLLIVDGSDPTAPEVLSNTRWIYDSSWTQYRYYYDYGYHGDQISTVRTDHAIATLEAGWDDASPATAAGRSHRLRVVDVSDPRDPHVTFMPLEDDQQYSGLVADDDSVWTSHYEVEGASAGKARFYADRIDLSNPEEPVPAASINVPGALVHVDPSSGDLLTSELVRKTLTVDTSQECIGAFLLAEFEPDDPNDWAGSGTCKGYFQRLHLVSIDDGVAAIEDTVRLQNDERVTKVAIGDGVLFAAINSENYYQTWLLDGCFDYCGGYHGSVPRELLSLAGFGKRELAVGRLEVASLAQWPGYWGYGGVYASGKRALMLSHDQVAIIDASDVTRPKLVRTEPLYGYASSVQVTDDGRVLMGLGLLGLQWFDLE